MTKYIGPKTDGENVATQADKLSLSSEAPDALTPDQTGAAGTATTAARSDHQHEILAGAAGTITPDAASAEGSSSSFARADHTHAIAAASAGTITGTNAEGSSTSFARADHDHAYGALSIPNSALALGPTYETSLPGSPVDGQEIYYAADAANGVIWHLRYRSAADGASAGSGAWEFVGGASLRDEVQTDQSMASSSYTGLTTAGPQVTVPLAGDYDVHIECSLYSASNVAVLMSYKIGATNASDDDAAEGGDFGNVRGRTHSSSRRHTGIAASTNFLAQYRASSPATANYRRRRMAVTPVRVWS